MADRPTERARGRTGGSNSGRTRGAILEVAMALLDERGPDGFTIDDVLVRSDASASSLYHHFGNREGLVLAAEGERYRQTMKREDLGNLDGGYTAETTEEFFAFIAAQLRRIAFDPDNRQTRRDRFAVVGRALTSPELAAGGQELPGPHARRHRPGLRRRPGEGPDRPGPRHPRLLRVDARHDARAHGDRGRAGHRRGVAAGRHPRRAGTPAPSARRRAGPGPSATRLRRRTA